MTRGLPLFLGLLVVLQCSVLSRAECDITKCEIPKHYREVAGCEPAKYAEGDEEKCCPIEYNCEAVSKQDKTKCHYKGKVYNDGEILESDDMPNCRRGCFCREGDFVCAHVECPEQVFNRPAPHCVIQSSRTKCCSESILCEEEKIEKLSTCYMDSKLYRQGEKMYPKDERCFTCICDEKWDNSTAITKNPACEEVDCAIDISFQSDLRMGCVPIYYGEPTCCPIDRKCPKSEDKPIPSLTRTAADPNLKCKFGDHDLMVGDKVTDNNKCVECECVIPPMITCVQKRNC